MPRLELLLLETVLKGVSPINDCEDVDLLILTMEELRIPHSEDVERQVMCAIKEKKIQLHFKEQWQKMGPTIKSSTTTSVTPYAKVASKPTQPAPFQGKKHKKKEKKTHLIPESEPLPIYAMGDEIASRAVVPNANSKGYFDRQAIFDRNRDKRVRPGYSSTGVKLPTEQAKKERNQKLIHYREVYYTNKKYKEEGDPKRGNGYIYIDTPM